MEQLSDSTKRWRSFVRYRWHSCPVIRLSWSIEGRHFIFRANYWRRFREKMIWIEKSFWPVGHSFLDITISYSYRHFTLRNIIIQKWLTIFVQKQISMEQWTIFVLVLNVQYTGLRKSSCGIVIHFEPKLDHLQRIEKMATEVAETLRNIVGYYRSRFSPSSAGHSGQHFHRFLIGLLQLSSGHSISVQRILPSSHLHSGVQGPGDQRSPCSCKIPS